MANNDRKRPLVISSSPPARPSGSGAPGSHGHPQPMPPPLQGGRGQFGMGVTGGSSSPLGLPWPSAQGSGRGVPSSPSLPAVQQPTAVPSGPPAAASTPGYQYQAPSGPTWQHAAYGQPWSSGGPASQAPYRPQQGSDFYTSSYPSSEGNVANTWDQATRAHRGEILKEAWDLGAQRALREYVDKLPIGETKGWCRLTSVAATKDSRGNDKYVQISLQGMNKFTTLQEALLILQGVWGDYDPLRGDQASHRCNQRLCTIPSHICVEDAVANNNRKGCAIMMWCPCGVGMLLLCEHDPLCIPNWRPREAPSFEAFLASVNICHHKVTVGGKPETRPGRPQRVLR